MNPAMKVAGFFYTRYGKNIDKPRNTFVDFFRAEQAFKDFLIFRILEKVQKNMAAVVLTSEAIDYKRLAHLPCPVDEQALYHSIFIFFTHLTDR